MTRRIPLWPGGESTGKRNGKPQFLSEEVLHPLCAPGTSFAPPDSAHEEFVTCVTRVASVAPSGRVLVVSHREGIRDLCELCPGSEGRVRTPYCCIAYLTLTPTLTLTGRGAWSLASPIVDPARREPAQ